MIIVIILGSDFVYGASVEGRNLVAALPAASPAYRAATKMLIPFVL